jgi:pimeloyl-ACP methyl ester carboxylesterase
MRIRRRILFRVLIVLVVLLGAAGIAVYTAVGTFAVSIPESVKGDQPGALVAVERIGKYPGFAAQYLLNSAGLPEPIRVTHGVTLYRVQYRTTNYDGSGVVASGLVALPNGGSLEKVVVYLHGTSVERRDAPSQRGLGEGLFVAAAAAGTGNVLVAPDYIGLGESHTLHPYLYARTTSSAAIDLLHAARALVEHLRGECPTAVYLMGFSQGGHATFAVQRDLEKLHDPQFEVQASAPIAGPFHLREVSFPQALTGKTKYHSLYLAFIAYSYAQIYHQPLQTVLTAPYVERGPVLFDGNHKMEEIQSALPTEPRKLFNPEFLEAYDKGQPHWFLAALKENNVDAWTPAAQVRMYFGDDDLDVLPEEARREEGELKRRGAKATAISVGSCDHVGSALRAIPLAIRWFNELGEKKSAG